MAKAKKHWQQPPETGSTPEGIEKVRYFIYRDELPVRISYYSGDVVAGAEIPLFKDDEWSWAVSHDHTNVPTEGGQSVTKRKFDIAVQKYIKDHSAEPLGSAPAP